MVFKMHKVASICFSLALWGIFRCLSGNKEHAAEIQGLDLSCISSPMVSSGGRKRWIHGNQKPPWSPLTSRFPAEVNFSSDV